MKLTEKQKQLLDSICHDDLAVIASIIRLAEVEGDYNGRDEDGGSFWCESTSDTIDTLARFFETYDHEDVID